MKLAFWRKDSAPEKRQSAPPLSHAYIDAILQQATGSASSNPTGLASLEACAGAYSRAFAAAVVTPSDRPETRALTPSLMALIARDCIRLGESMILITVVDGQVQLIPAGSWDISGDADPASWMVRCDVYGPSRSTSHYVSYQSVLHFKYAYNASRQDRGTSPLSYATSTAGFAANLENRLAEESGARSGYIIPLPAAPADADTEDDPNAVGALTKLKQDLASAKGKTSFVESTNSGYGDKDARPQKDWIQSRYGFAPPDVLTGLRSDVGKAIIAACGLSIALFDDSDGTSKRESLRQAVTTAYIPLGRLISAELTSKLGVYISLSFTDLWGHDAVGRSQALKNMIIAGVPLEKALGLSGIMGLEE